MQVSEELLHDIPIQGLDQDVDEVNNGNGDEGNEMPHITFDNLYVDIRLLSDEEDDELQESRKK